MAGNTNNSGQDSEEAAELMATMKSEHIPMKSWYNHPDHQVALSNLKAKHGEFPSFWQDLVKWGGWKEVRRVYLRFTETGSFGSENGDRKRNHWTEDDPKNNSQAASEGNNDASASVAAPRKRKSRWGRGRDDTPKPSINAPTPAPVHDPVMAALGLSSLPAAAPSATPAGLPSLLSSNLTADQQSELTSLQSRLREANRILANLPAEAVRVDSLPRDHPSRSPSPPPVYDAHGNRKNTRANRWKERYTEERLVCLERIAELCPSMKPTLAGVTKRKRSRKIPIPVDEHPTYNFIGLIIGPRGKTQKDMEAKTGCKIAIRGKGSVKEGAKGRLTKNGTAQLAEGEDEPLHVVITGDDPAAIDAAAEMVTQMLVVIDDEKNVHKQNQLRELALLNGTLKEEEWCHLCGEKGHRNFECPKKFALNNRSVLKVKCAICGDTSHPTRDCSLRGKAGLGVETLGGEQSEVEKEKQLDSDYSAFMAELEGKSASAAGENGAASAPPDMGSVLTIIQPARVVKVGESTEDNTPSASAAPAVDPNTGVTTISAVTTISSTVIKPTSTAATDATTGVTTISSSTVPGVTTISSTANSPALAVAPPAAPGVTTLSSTGLPPAPTALPPLPPGVPPPLPPGYPPAPSASVDGGAFASTPAGAAAAENNGSVAGATAPLPPPPAAPGVAPPAATAHPGYGQHYGGQHGQWTGYYPQPQQPPPPGGYPQHQGYGTYQQHPQSQWVGYNAGAYGQAQYPQQGGSNNATDETAGWDPNSYYGAAANGAGGFNWWESSS